MRNFADIIKRTICIIDKVLGVIVGHYILIYINYSETALQGRLLKVFRRRDLVVCIFYVKDTQKMQVRLLFNAILYL